MAARTAKPAVRLERASDLAARLTGSKPAVHFTQGQRVRHAEYGEGVLTKITGVGPRSLGTVCFDGPAGTRKFVLGHGSLEPV